MYRTEKSSTGIVFLILSIIIVSVVIIFFVNVSNNENTTNGNNNMVENNNVNNDINNEEEEVVKEKELFEDYYKKAEEILVTMSLEEKVSQMFFVRCPESGAVEEIKEYHPGGYILFGRDFKNKTKAQVISNISSYQKASKIPLLIGVDEEGGTVVRVSAYQAFSKTKFKSPQEIYRNGGFDAIVSDTNIKSDLLLSLGINVNLAPVADVSTNKNDYINDRSFGKDANKTAEYIEIVVKTMNNKKISSTLKHFPGYGNNIDTHTGISYDKRSKESFINSDFLPFIAGIKQNVPSILVSHNVVESFDDKYPASISADIHKILRDELKFTGIIMTDDMAMDGLKTFKLDEFPEVFAVLAGNDLIITSSFKEQSINVLNAVKSGRIDLSIIDTAVRRVLAWKCSKGII